MGTAKGHKNIAESKIAASIEKFEGKRELWREWVSKFVTAIDQFRPGSRGILEMIIKRDDVKEYDKDVHDTLFPEDDTELHGIYDNLNRDLWYIWCQKQQEKLIRK